MDIGRDGRRSRLLLSPESGAGIMTGWSSLTSKRPFDQIDHGLLLKAVRTHIREGWILLYVERWLTAPFESAEGEQLAAGTRHAARRSGLTDLDEPVHALCVRYLDEAKQSAMSVCPLCR